MKKLKYGLEKGVPVRFVDYGGVLSIVPAPEDPIKHASRRGTRRGSSIQQVEVSRALALQAAHYKARFKMSYADCLAVALANQLRAVLVTGDPEMRRQHEAELLWIGPGGPGGRDLVRGLGG